MGLPVSDTVPDKDYELLKVVKALRIRMDDFKFRRDPDLLAFTRSMERFMFSQWATDVLLSRAQTRRRRSSISTTSTTHGTSQSSQSSNFEQPTTQTADGVRVDGAGRSNLYEQIVSASSSLASPISYSLSARLPLNRNARSERASAEDETPQDLNNGLEPSQSVSFSFGTLGSVTFIPGSISISAPSSASTRPPRRPRDDDSDADSQRARLRQRLDTYVSELSNTSFGVSLSSGSSSAPATHQAPLTLSIAAPTMPMTPPELANTSSTPSHPDHCPIEDPSLTPTSLARTPTLPLPTSHPNPETTLQHVSNALNNYEPLPDLIPVSDPPSSEEGPEVRPSNSTRTFERRSSSNVSTDNNQSRPSRSRGSRRSNAVSATESRRRNRRRSREEPFDPNGEGLDERRVMSLVEQHMGNAAGDGGRQEGSATLGRRRRRSRRNVDGGENVGAATGPVEMPALTPVGEVHMTSLALVRREVGAAVGAEGGEGEEFYDYGGDPYVYMEYARRAGMRLDIADLYGSSEEESFAEEEPVTFDGVWQPPE
ncbi:hypothetical protein HDV05_000130 [Chytridiales sp. JEL 0842]|nr:hypothetical protein HDV05_000130 [Chytridiales sp. JEL 0842]